MVKLRKAQPVNLQEKVVKSEIPAERKKFLFFTPKAKSKPPAASPQPIEPSYPPQIDERYSVPNYEQPPYRRPSSQTLVSTPPDRQNHGPASRRYGYMGHLHDGPLEDFSEKTDNLKVNKEQAVISHRPRRHNFPEPPTNRNPSCVNTASQRSLATLPASMWGLIAEMLSPVDAANLAISSMVLRYRLGSQPWRALTEPQNKNARNEFLLGMDDKLPNHLFCFLCSSYHLRLQPGEERIYPTIVGHPVFTCLNARSLPLPRTRLAHGREMPYNIVQLALRYKSYSPQYGIPLSALARGWKCKDSEWSHRTMFHIHKGHLLMRVTSTCFATASITPSQERLLLFSRSEYAPYFSACDHWHTGDLMRLAKCALSHVPKPREGVIDQLKKSPKMPSKALLNPDLMPRQCDECKSLRRCPQCPTEYIIEIKIVEDKKDPEHRFKHAICVTRWSDLGDGSSPFTSPEWLACNGKTEFDSFAAVGNATLCSHFEGAVSNHAPGQRAMSLWSHGGSADDVY